MGDWNHTYDPASIGPQDTITDHTPGAKIGAAITEIQDKCATSAELVPGPGLNGDAEIADNHLTIRVSLDKTSPESGGDGLAGVAGSFIAVTGVALTDSALTFARARISVVDGQITEESLDPIVIPVDTQLI